MLFAEADAWSRVFSGQNLVLAGIVLALLWVNRGSFGGLFKRFKDSTSSGGHDELVAEITAAARQKFSAIHEAKEKECRDACDAAKKRILEDLIKAAEPEQR